jgi:hypothetical protein
MDNSSNSGYSENEMVDDGFKQKPMQTMNHNVLLNSNNLGEKYYFTTSMNLLAVVSRKKQTRTQDKLIPLFVVLKFVANPSKNSTKIMIPAFQSQEIRKIHKLLISIESLYAIIQQTYQSLFFNEPMIKVMHLKFKGFIVAPFFVKYASQFL